MLCFNELKPESWQHYNSDTTSELFPTYVDNVLPWQKGQDVLWY